jgi:N-acetylmuramoyl-L-alanine amidase
MKYTILLLSAMVAYTFANAQQITSIHYNALADSIKKGFHFYVNVDAKLSNGRWKPLTDKELNITSTHGKVVGNNIILPFDFAEKQIDVQVVLKQDTLQKLTLTIPVKQMPDPPLQQIQNNSTSQEVTTTKKKKRRRRSN